MNDPYIVSRVVYEEALEEIRQLKIALNAMIAKQAMLQKRADDLTIELAKAIELVPYDSLWGRRWKRLVGIEVES